MSCIFKKIEVYYAIPPKQLSIKRSGNNWFLKHRRRITKGRMYYTPFAIKWFFFLLFYKCFGLLFSVYYCGKQVNTIG